MPEKDERGEAFAQIYQGIPSAYWWVAFDGFFIGFTNGDERKKSPGELARYMVDAANKGFRSAIRSAVDREVKEATAKLQYQYNTLEILCNDQKNEIILLKEMKNDYEEDIKRVGEKSRREALEEAERLIDLERHSVLNPGYLNPSEYLTDEKRMGTIEALVKAAEIVRSLAGGKENPNA